MTRRTKVPENSVQLTVIEALNLGRWRWIYHAKGRVGSAGKWQTPMKGHPGWPDIFAVRGDVALAIECKSDTGRVSPDQEIWGLALTSAGVRWHVVGPDQLDRILEVLA